MLILLPRKEDENNSMKKLCILLKFAFFQLSGGTKAAYRKAEYLKKHNIFSRMGENCYWHPLNIPMYPDLVSLGNNVTICADVVFYEHDIVHRMWNYDSSYSGPKVHEFKEPIVIEDNVVIGGNSIILYNVRIGKNALVAAGSVITKDVAPYAIVAGNPARKIGDTRELYARRVNESMQLRGTQK